MTEDDTVRTTRGDDRHGASVDGIVGTYLAVATVWILFSSPVAAGIGRRVGLSVPMIELGKGLAFVLVTGLVLRAVLGGWARRIQAAADREREVADRLRESEAVRSTFLNSVSHELRTPLSSIAGYGSTIHRHAADLTSEQVGELAGRLVANAERLERLVLDLLDTDALMRGVETVHVRRTDIGPLVRRAVNGTDPGGRTIDLDGPPLVAEVDEAKVERVIQLLLDNVARHTSTTAAVSVRWGNRGPNLVLTVDDDGPGLAPGLSERVFEPFVQGGTARNSARPGLGIGLTLVDQYVRLHHGRVVATNRPDGGAHIEVTLPIAQPSGAGPASPVIA